MTSTERDIAYDLKYYQSNLEPDVEMSISIHDQLRVFLAYRALFKGQNAQVRQPKSIRKILRSNKASSSPLVQSLGYDKVVSVIKGLLEKEIFSSELKAKLAFPVLYETSPEQNARHEASEVGAAKEEAEALQEVEALDDAHGDEDGAGALKDPGFGEDKMLPDALNGDEDVVQDSQHPNQETDTSIPSLYPVQLPFKTQHSILARSQKLLEECCYDFTQNHATDLLREKKWDCAEAIELNKWTLTMIKRKGKVTTGAFADSDTSINTILLAVNKLRHSAVHRLRISAKGVLQMLDDAVKLAQTLSDSTRASQLEELYKELQSMIKSQELNKNFLETKLNNELAEITRLREELMRREQKAISTMVTEDEENTHFVGSLLERRLRNIMDGYHTDDEPHESDPQDQLDDVVAEAAIDDAHEAGSPEKQEPPKPVSNGITPSVGIEDEEVADDATTNGWEIWKKNYDTTNQFESIPMAEPVPEQNSVHDTLAAEPFPEECPSIEPITTELQPEITLDGSEVGAVTEQDNVQEHLKSRESDIGPPDDIELPATEPTNQLVQPISMADIIQNILKGQDIDAASLRLKSKSKSKIRRKRYDADIAKIQQDVSESIRRELENDTYGELIAEQIKEYIENRDNDDDPWPLN